jgi:hypothetical protein
VPDVCRFRRIEVVAAAAATSASVHTLEKARTAPLSLILSPRVPSASAAGGGYRRAMPSGAGFSNVLWIGGPPGTGKTTITRWLAHRYDLRAYHSDAHTWEHHDRAVARAYPAAAQWEAMTPDERWLAPVDELVALTLAANAERCALMLEDLGRLPAAPAIVAEGTPLLPTLVAAVSADASRALWLIPSPEFERRALEARPTTSFDATSDPQRARENRIRRELAVAAEIERQARERGFHVVRVDGTRDLPTVQRVVEDTFADALARLPRATTPEERFAIRRGENATVYAQLSTYLDRVPAAGTRDEVTFPFACECGRSDDVETRELSIDDFERLMMDGGRVVARSHA